MSDMTDHSGVSDDDLLAAEFVLGVLTGTERAAAQRLLERDANFLARLAAGAGVRRFTQVRFQLATARAPQPAIRLLRPVQQQHFIRRVETVEQRRNFIGQRHCAE